MGTIFDNPRAVSALANLGGRIVSAEPGEVVFEFESTTAMLRVIDFLKAHDGGRFSYNSKLQDGRQVLTIGRRVSSARVSGSRFGRAAR